MHRQPDRLNTNHLEEYTEKCARLVIQEEAFWKQRAKMHWLKQRDVNTRFFYMSTVSRGKVKKVIKLVSDNGYLVMR